MADIVVVGAGLSGSLAAIALNRRGFQVTVIDRYKKYPADFRAEQIVGSQLKIFSDLGLLDRLVADVQAISQARNFSFGKQLSSVLTPHYGLPYQDIVQAIRSQIPDTVPFIVGRVTDIETSPHPVIRLDNGETVEAKLVVMATGLNTTLSERLGINYQTISARHSTTIGFNIASPKCHAADTPILVYYGDGLRNGIDYLTVFPCKDVLRGNLFLYRDPLNPWVRQFRQAPRETLLEALPELLDQLGDFTITQVQSRSSDVAVAGNLERDGIVFVGDAYQTSCPAAGTGIGRLAVDVERLTVHAARWFKTGDVSATALRSYYADPVKRRSDRKAIQKAHFRRALTTDTSLQWAFRRQTVKMRHFVRFFRNDAMQAISARAAQRAPWAPWSRIVQWARVTRAATAGDRGVLPEVRATALEAPGLLHHDRLGA